ncbi:MAG TPA: YeeE/YedE thiosulfate transporter family protein [Nevskiales bacterium]|nr:YeeE/YedE thiosulfate transporter family protein [Nevskiales bacterium]
MSLWPALLGGVLIGASALLLYAAFGRIAGISGIAFGTLFGAAAERRWRLLFLGGLVLGGWLAVITGIAAMPHAPLPDAAGIALIVLAGLLVGLGTRLGNGCTSGHGVCGLARLSRRSLVSVLLFMGAGIATASLLRPLLAGLAP